MELERPRNLDAQLTMLLLCAIRWRNSTTQSSTFCFNITKGFVLKHLTHQVHPPGLTGLRAQEHTVAMHVSTPWERRQQEGRSATKPKTSISQYGHETITLRNTLKCPDLPCSARQVPASDLQYHKGSLG